MATESTTPILSKHPVEATLYFIRSMRTSPRLTGEEAIEWARLEAEFETRKKELFP